MPLNILHIVGGKLPDNPDKIGVSGIVHAVLRLAETQAKRGHDVMVASLSPKMTFSTEWRNVRLVGVCPFPVGNVTVGSRRIDLRDHLPFVWMTRNMRFDIVQTHLRNYTRFLKARAIFVHFHGDPYYNGGNNEGLSYSSSDFATIRRFSVGQLAPSRFVVEQLARGFGTTKNLYLVPNGVAHTEFHTRKVVQNSRALRESLGIRSDALVGGFAGAIVKEKGVLQLAKAVLDVSRVLPRFHMLMVGSSSLWGNPNEPDRVSEYEMNVTQLLLPLVQTHRVHFLGRIPAPDMPTIYAALDFLVVPSLVQEGFSLVTLEAMASGKPVIASSNGALPELIGDQRCGLSLGRCEPYDIAKSIVRLATDSKLMYRMGIEGRRLSKSYSWDNAATILDNIYFTHMRS